MTTRSLPRRLALPLFFALLHLSVTSHAEPASKGSFSPKNTKGGSGAISGSPISGVDPSLPQKPKKVFVWSKLRYRVPTEEERLAAHENAMFEYWKQGTLASAAALDRLESRIIDFGTITISAPLLSQPGDAFSFDLNKSADDYFNFAKSDVQGIFQNRESIVSSTQISGSITQDSVVEGRLERIERADQAAEVQAVQDQLLAQEISDMRRGAIEREYNADVKKAETETDPDKKERALVAAENKRATALQGLLSDEEPDYTAPGVLPSRDAVPDLLATPRTTLDKLTQTTPAAALVTGVNPTMSSRSAIVTAAGDNAVESIFKLLGNPEKYVNYQDKVLLFGVVAVSVTPGKETTQNYAADVSVALRYDWTRAKASTLERLAKVPSNAGDATELNALAQRESKLRTVDEDKLYRSQSDAYKPPAPQGLNPLVVAVSPLMEQQIIDQTSSFRKQTEMALQLSALLAQAGMKGQADAVTQFIKKQEADARTRDPIGLVNTYSHAGGTFGFRVSPRLQALTDASSRKAKSGRVLTPQSFPSLVIIAIDAEDYQPKVLRDENKKITAVWEPSFTFLQTSRWIPLSGDTKGMISTCGAGAYWTERDRQSELVWGWQRHVDAFIADVKDKFVPNGPTVEIASSKDASVDAENTPSWNSDQVARIQGRFNQLLGLSAQLRERWDAVELQIKDNKTSVTIPAEVIVPSRLLARLPEVFHVQTDKDFIVEKDKNADGANQPPPWKPLTREITLIGSGFENLDVARPVEIDVGPRATASLTVMSGADGKPFRTNNLLRIQVVLTPTKDYAPSELIQLHLRMPEHYRSTGRLLPESPEPSPFSKGEFFPVRHTIVVKAKPTASPLRVAVPQKIFSDPVILKPTVDGKGWEETKVNFSLVGTDFDVVESVWLTNGVTEVQVTGTKTLDKSVIVTQDGGFPWKPAANFDAPTLFVVRLKLKQDTEPKGPESITAPGVLSVTIPNGKPDLTKVDQESPIQIDIENIRGVVKPAEENKDAENKAAPAPAEAPPKPGQ